MHRKKDMGLPWRHFAGAALIVWAASMPLCLSVEWAFADEPSLMLEGAESAFHKRHVRHLRQRDNEAVLQEGSGDAKRFAARLKHHQRHNFTQRRREFRKQQVRLEAQRRLTKAKLRAHQFAAARRHAAGHAVKHKQTHISPKGRNS